MLGNFLSKEYSDYLKENYKDPNVVGMSSVDVQKFVSEKLGLSFSRSALVDLVQSQDQNSEKKKKQYVTGPVIDNTQSGKGRRVRYGLQTVKDILVYRYAFGFYGAARKGKMDFAKEWSIENISNIVDNYIILKSDPFTGNILDLREFYVDCGRQLIKIAKDEFEWIYKWAKKLHECKKKVSKYKVNSEEEYTEFVEQTERKDSIERMLSGIQITKWEDIVERTEKETKDEFQERIKKVKNQTISDFVCLGGLYFFFDQWFRHSDNSKESAEAIYKNWRYLMEMLEVNYSCNFIVERISDLMEGTIKAATVKDVSILENNINTKAERDEIKQNQYDDKIENEEEGNSFSYLARTGRMLKNTNISMSKLSLFYSEYISSELSNRDRIQILQWFALLLTFSNGYGLIENEVLDAIRYYSPFENVTSDDIFKIACHMYLIGNLHLIR